MFNISFNPYKSYSDEELIQAYKESENNKYIGELYKRYQHLVMGIALKYLNNKNDAADITMDVFEIVLKKITNRDIANFKGWLYIITKNHIFSKFRNKMLNSVEFKNDLMENEVIDTLYYDYEMDSTFEQLEKAMNTLNNQQRICVQEFYLKDKSYKDIAEEMSLDLNAVKSFIQNGKRNLKIFLQKNI